MSGIQSVDIGEILRTGMYPVPVAARLIGAQPRKVASWIEGYKHSGAEPILVRQFPRVGGKAILGFLDLIEAAFVRHFRSIGYSPQTIRKVATKLRDKHDVHHPFAMNKRFRADGKRIFEESVEDDGERRLVDIMTDNFVISAVVEQSLFDQIFYVEDVAREWFPLRNKFPDVIIKPDVSFGRPVIQNLWIPTETLNEAFFAEGSVEAAAEEFNISPGLVRQAVKFEQELDKRVIH